MNWDEIKEKYPKAFKQLQNWLHEENMIFKVGHIRDLYDFFDEQGIYGRVGKNLFMMFIWDLITDPKIDVYEASNYDYNTRPEAEEKLFLRAFEILEVKL